jgi:probable F420-dependent oxidoreductase
MKFGLALFGLSPRHYGTVAAAAEEYGFESVWIPEHLVFPAEMPATYPYTEAGYPPVTPATPLFDPWVVLGSIAALTTTVRLGTQIYVLPLRHPIATARSVVTVDRLSGGRVTLGVGVGWLEDEFDIMGLSFRDRGRRTDEIVEVLRRLWAEETIEHHGRHFDFGPVRFEPKPVQKASLPIEIGGASPAALRRAGRLGDGWIEIGARDLVHLAEMLATVERHRRDAGRADLPFEVTTTGDKAPDRDAVRRARDVGVTRVIAGPVLAEGERFTPEGIVEWAKRYADNVMAGVNA